jgi:hypothetical protein
MSSGANPLEAWPDLRDVWLLELQQSQRQIATTLQRLIDSPRFGGPSSPRATARSAGSPRQSQVGAAPNKFPTRSRLVSPGHSLVSQAAGLQALRETSTRSVASVSIPTAARSESQGPQAGTTNLAQGAGPIETTSPADRRSVPQAVARSESSAGMVFRTQPTDATDGTTSTTASPDSAGWAPSSTQRSSGRARTRDRSPSMDWFDIAGEPPAAPTASQRRSARDSGDRWEFLETFASSFAGIAIQLQNQISLLQSSLTVVPSYQQQRALQQQIEALTRQLEQLPQPAPYFSGSLLTTPEGLVPVASEPTASGEWNREAAVNTWTLAELSQRLTEELAQPGPTYWS